MVNTQLSFAYYLHCRDCPSKQPGLYLLIFFAIVIQVMSLLPKVKPLLQNSGLLFLIEMAEEPQLFPGSANNSE